MVNARVFEHRILCVRRFSVVLERERPPLEATASGPLTCITHCTMSISCAPRFVICPPE